MSDLSAHKALSNWTDLVHPKNENVYKRELLIEKTAFCIEVGAFILPVARRVMANTIGNDLVAVQPLELPTGMLHYIDYNIERKDLYKRVLLIETYKKPKSRRSRRGGRRFGQPFIDRWNHRMWNHE